MDKISKIKHTAKHIKNKALATKLFYSNQLEELRKKAIEQGALPYRILQYSRVVAPEKNPMPIIPGGYIHPDLFEKQMKYLAKECKPITLDSLLELIENNKKIPDRTVVVTLDGGHMDNYLYAFPKLLQNQIPATFFLPTGYINNDLFFYNDRLALCLLNIKSAKKGLPILDFLSDEIQDTLNQISPTGEITEELINYLSVTMATAPQEDRALLMDAFANLEQDIPLLPEYEDFMRWDDIRHMQSVGFTFGSMGHFAVAYPNIPQALYADDLGTSIKTLQENNISPITAVCLPSLAPTMETMQALGELGCRFAMTNLFFPEPRFQTKLPMLLSRIPISQINASSIDLFACRLWGIELEEN